MTKIALVSITINGALPMTEYLAKNHPDIKVTNYLDGYLMQKVNDEGGIREDSMGRFFQLLSNAAKDGNDAIIITCTVFSKYQPYFQELIPVPIIGADTAMLKALAQAEGKKAIVYSFPGTYDTTLNGYKKACESLGLSSDVDMILAEGAFDAAQGGNLAKSTMIVRNKILEIESSYDHIALAQISIAEAITGLEPTRASFYTSPACAVAALGKAME